MKYEKKNICEFFFQTFLQTMFSTSPYSDPVTSLDVDPKPIVDEEEGLLWVVGPVLAVIFIVCIVIAILLFKRSGPRQTDTDTALE